MGKSSGGVIQAVEARLFTPPPKAQPNEVYVVSYRDGHLRAFTGALSAGDRLTARLCFIVDTSEHNSTSSCTVTSAVDAYEFAVELSATWRVTDAEAAVRGGLTDGSRLVLSSLQDTVWQVARGYQPQQAAAAENAVRARLVDGMQLPSGIAVVRAAARFRADKAVTGATKDRDTTAHKADLERARMTQLRELFDGSEASALMIHLLQHPDDTGTVLGTLKDSREKEQALKLAMLGADREHYLAMLDRALASDLINEDDAQPLRDLLFGQAAGATLGGSVNMVPIAPRPVLSLPPGIAASGTTSTPSFGAPAAGRAPAPAPQTAQGYVVETVVTVAEDQDPAAPAPPGAASGGVAGWKPIGKKHGQGS